jgi:transposase
MKLNEEEKAWCQNHTRPEVEKRFNISSATLSRWLKENNINCKRKSGSGLNNPRKKPAKLCFECGKLHTNKKYCSKECMYNSKYYIDMLRSVDRSYMKTEEYSKTLRNPNTPEYKKYAGKVHRLTRYTYEKYKGEINPNNYSRTICGVKNGYQLDHIIPIKFGYENDIPPEVLAEKSNLRMLPWKENLMRNYSKN